MPSITWPSTLPQPEQSGYGEQAPNSTIRTEMDAGPVKMRRRYTAAPRLFSLTYHLTAAEVATLDAFYVTTSRSGSLEFNWVNPRTLAACTARFVDAPRYSAVGHEADVSVQIEVLP